MDKKKGIPLSREADFCFMAMMQVALLMKESGKDRKFFVDFADGIWESLEMNDRDELKKALTDRMMSDLKKFAREFE